MKKRKRKLKGYIRNSIFHQPIRIRIDSLNFIPPVDKKVKIEVTGIIESYENMENGKYIINILSDVLQIG